MSKYKYILLDWDGNLAKTLDIWLEACRIPIEKRGLKLSDEEIASSFGAFRKYIKKWGFDDVEEIINEADEIAKQKLPYVELYPDAIEVLEGLNDGGKKLALITTSPHTNIKHLLEKYNVAKHFHVIVAGDDTLYHKPNPEPLELAIKLLGGNKELSVMIGDSDKDLGAAKNAGVDSILFYPTEHRKFYDIAKLNKFEPTFIVNDFRQILDLV